MSEEVAVRVEGLWKRYGLGLRHKLRALGNGTRAPSDDGPWALKGISLDVKRGETLGIIGRNGAGKSTLLKVLARVTPATRGSVDVRGRVFPMIELNAGLHMELTGDENVRLLASIMGLRRREVKGRMNRIEEFCELGDWFHKPVRMYSSGMLARLGFGVAMNVNADLLLVDEILAVGDLSFQRRCYDQLDQLRREGVTVIIVSHALRQVERLCDRAVILAHGEVDSIGETADVVNRYFNQSTEVTLGQHADSSALPRISSGEVTIRSVDILDGHGNAVDALQVGQPFTIRVGYEAYELLNQPNVALNILTADLLLVTNFSTDNETERPDWSGTGTVDCRISDPRLLPGVYYLRIVVRRNDGFKCFQTERAKAFRVVSGDYEIRRDNFGVVLTPVSWNFHPRT